jgi:hypothetical protein
VIRAGLATVSHRGSDSTGRTTVRSSAMSCCTSYQQQVAWCLRSVETLRR